MHFSFYLTEVSLRFKCFFKSKCITYKHDAHNHDFEFFLVWKVKLLLVDYNKPPDLILWKAVCNSLIFVYHIWLILISSNSFQQVTTELFNHNLFLLFYQLILTMSVSCQRVRPALFGMQSVLQSSWPRGGSSSATTSSMSWLIWSLLRYWPPGLYNKFNNLLLSFLTYTKKNSIQLT